MLEYMLDSPFIVSTEYKHSTLLHACFQWNSVLPNQHLGLVRNNKINENHTILGLF